jgi:RNA polymerase-binding transcription factor DksA
MASSKAAATTPKRSTGSRPLAASRAKVTTTSSGSAALPVRDDEEPWTSEEIAEIRGELERDISRSRRDLQVAEEDLQGLIRDSGDGSGDDQADAGTKTYERDQEISLANISRDKLAQSQHALERLDGGRYGVCESCGQPIGKFRLQAAPRATLCRSCKEKAERG